MADATDILRRLDALEAESAVRAVLARYVEICDDLPAHDLARDLGPLFTEDAVWAGKGDRYGDAFGGHRGRKAILAFLEGYRRPAHFRSNVHFLTSESVDVDGDTASGTWVMLQTPTFHDGQSFALAARLHVEFRRENDAWAISRFATTNLLGRSVDGPWSAPTPIPTPAHQDRT